VAKPVDLSAENFEEEVLKGQTPVLVDFWSPSCPHCRRLNPEFEKAAELAQGKAKFVKVSLEDARPLFAQHEVNAVPTMILFLDGKPLTRREGSRTAEQILSWLETHL
jgi:thioredoxin 1